MPTISELRAELERGIPELWHSCEEIAEKWTAQIRSNLDELDSEKTAFPKTFTDPVLGPLELFEWEVAILDSPLLQRLSRNDAVGKRVTVWELLVL
jgi:hypothetical protein